MHSEPNPLLKPLRKLYKILYALSKVPAFCTDELVRDLKQARKCIKEIEYAFAMPIHIHGVPGSVRQKLQNIAYNKGITGSAFLRQELNKILSREHIAEEEVVQVMIFGVPLENKNKLAALAARSGFCELAEFLRHEFHRIIRETPEHLQVKRS